MYINDKWDREKCRKRFVEHEDDITFDALAKMASLSRGTLAKWSKQDEKEGRQKWTDQRIEHRKKLAKQITQRIHEKNKNGGSERLSDKIMEAQKTQIDSHQIYQEIAITYGRITLNQMRRVEAGLSMASQLNDPDAIDTWQKRLNELAGFNVNMFSLILDRANKGIATALGMNYFVNANAAIDSVESMGYTTVELPPEMAKEDLDKALTRLANNSLM